MFSYGILYEDYYGKNCPDYEYARIYEKFATVREISRFQVQERTVSEHDGRNYNHLLRACRCYAYTGSDEPTRNQGPHLGRHLPDFQDTTVGLRRKSLPECVSWKPPGIFGH